MIPVFDPSLSSVPPEGGTPAGAVGSSGAGRTIAADAFMDLLAALSSRLPVQAVERGAAKVGSAHSLLIGQAPAAVHDDAEEAVPATAAGATDGSADDDDEALHPWALSMVVGLIVPQSPPLPVEFPGVPSSGAPSGLGLTAFESPGAPSSGASFGPGPTAFESPGAPFSGAPLGGHTPFDEAAPGPTDGEMEQAPLAVMSKAGAEEIDVFSAEATGQPSTPGPDGPAEAPGSRGARSHGEQRSVVADARLTELGVLRGQAPDVASPGLEQALRPVSREAGVDAGVGREGTRPVESRGSQRADAAPVVADADPSADAFTDSGDADSNGEESRRSMPAMRPVTLDRSGAPAHATVSFQQAVASELRSAGPVAPAQPVPADAGGLDSQIVQAVQRLWRDGVEEMRVTLRPEYLGGLTVSLSVEDDAVTAVLHVEDPQVRAWVESHEPQLRQAMSNQGLTLEEFVVTDERRERQGGSEREASRPRKPARRREHPDATPVFEVAA